MNQYGYSTLRVISTKCVPSEEITQHIDKEEDKNDVKEETWIMGKRNKESSNKCDSDDACNVKNTHELSESDTEDCEECEENDDRHWQEKFL